MATHACPVCKQPAESERARNAYWPFCSRRCKTVDLGRWLDEGYRIPDEGVEAQDQDKDSTGKPVPPRGEGERNG